ncbi:MAG: C4-dicarboxylate ABC transporter permease [Betaproteobacteria bacterium RIFCSPLOWO2_12_FULL_63_13]|nr:MAG: C4-dicarboxylate ABC transporter permease [Betaproteobacteria bacterium RIFCSPLOWO2_02_FULL_63_19]OGA45536.1 MAG: C4-dicarboxylate ABC transporter permease [Betaproteobacteria bacterium RIFCSPLOWO2_12_FULL_63_13]
MSDVAIGLTGFIVLLLVLAVRVPIGVGMLIVGAIGYASIAGPNALLNYLKTEMYWRYTSFDLSVVPLFILMGHFAEKAGLSQALFRAASVWIGHVRGGMAMAAIGACAGFGTISGSSLATAAMMGNVAIPELRRYNYKGSLATGALAAGGTLGILIPPSIVLIIFALMVEGNIVALFQAAFLPGLLAVAGYLMAIAIVVRIDPDAGPAGQRTTSKEKWAALLDIWPVVLIFVVVMGGLYGGLFTPTEAAAVGATGTFLVAVTRGGMRREGFVESLLDTAITSGMICLILLGADVFNAFLGFSQLPIAAVDFFQDSGLAPMAVLLGMIVLYVLLGCVMDSLSMILLTSPVFWPIVAGLEFGMEADDLKLWFGVITLIVVEVGLITPPVGLNVFVINGIARDVPMIDTFRGVLPFLASDAVRVALIVIFPTITLFLPRLIGG